MKKVIAIAFSITWIHCLIGEQAPSSELSLSSNSQDRFVDIINYLTEQSTDLSSDTNDHFPRYLSFEVAVNHNNIHVKSSKKQSTERNYNSPVTENEKNELVYITKTLAKSSLTSLASSKSSLKKAGDKITHLHPLRFLMTIFTDEELKAYISAIRSRGWVWDKFYDGLESSLKEESKKNNILYEFVVDFATVIGIEISSILPIIQDRRWKDFVNLLIESVPREGNPGRYDM